jgi:D-3-phosphoglycerate dehydrogenase / 2-oxoglutarate reductase
MISCLIIDDMHPIILSILKELGIDAHYLPLIKKEEVLEKIGAYEGIIVRSKLKLDKSFFDKATKLKFIARAGSGTDNIDVSEAQRLGIEILNAPEGNRDAVAEHAMALLLNLLNKIKASDTEVRNKVWMREANRGIELGHQTVGIIGYGNTGRAFSKRLSSFGCKVLAFDINGIKNPELGTQAVEMAAIFENADVLSLHIPLDARNKHIVNHEFLNHFKKPIWLINTARGELVKTSDLIDALESGKVRGAGLDVLENEKLQSYTEDENSLFEQMAMMNNVILTPHVAGWTHESYLKISEVLGGKIKEFVVRSF